VIGFDFLFYFIGDIDDDISSLFLPLSFVYLFAIFAIGEEDSSFYAIFYFVGYLSFCPKAFFFAELFTFYRDDLRSLAKDLLLDLLAADTISFLSDFFIYLCFSFEL
jgi:hypothetical protein